MATEIQIKRAYQPLGLHLHPNKVLVIHGPRRVGKTRLVEDFLKTTHLKYRYESGEDIRVQEILSSSDFKRIKEFCQGFELIVLDEAQNIPQVGKGLKIIVDQVPGIHVIATGSSSFDLSNKIGEPLVGRQRILQLHAVSIHELLPDVGPFDIRRNLEEYLIFGMYPEVLTTPGHEAKGRYLKDLVNSYLLKDILALENVKSPKLLMDLLRMLAFQVGSEVSLNELSNSLKIDVKTVARYIDLLEKSFILISLGGFSRNLRNEVVNKRKYYFYDTGVRNGVIGAFTPLELRNDHGLLWENFAVMERLKRKTYEPIHSNDYFWRTYAQKEIDLIEERDGKPHPYEFKWKEGPYKTPKDWRENYGTDVQLITPENLIEFVTFGQP